MSGIDRLPTVAIMPESPRRGIKAEQAFHDQKPLIAAPALAGTVQTRVLIGLAADTLSAVAAAPWACRPNGHFHAWPENRVGSTVHYL